MAAAKGEEVLNTASDTGEDWVRNQQALCPLFLWSQVIRSRGFVQFRSHRH